MAITYELTPEEAAQVDESLAYLAKLMRVNPTATADSAYTLEETERLRSALAAQHESAEIAAALIGSRRDDGR